MKKTLLLEKDEELINSLYKKARKLDTVEQAVEFINEILETYQPDYGGCVHLNTICTVALSNAIAYEFGMTGFQMGIVMWEYIARLFGYEKQPMKLLKFEKMLYPQYEFQFKNIMSQSTWDWLREKAKEKLDEYRKEDPSMQAANVVKNHWEKIAKGTPPFDWSVEKEVE